MFTIDDLWKIMLYLKDGTISPGLDGLTSSLATSEREISKAFFEQILDQNTFVSNDYRRLRTMLIDWYSSHKTIATTQKYASDVHRLPNKHLSELFRSFGFPLGLDIVPLSSKANFFLDLVNFYKKNVYICGLNSDFKRKPFGNWLDLEQICDRVTHLHSWCSICKKNPALFSHRLTNETEKIIIGSDNYIPVCRTCWLTVNI